MKLNPTSINIVFNKSGECWSDASGFWHRYYDVEELRNDVKLIRKGSLDEKIAAFTDLKDRLVLSTQHEIEIEQFCNQGASEKSRREVCTKIIDFFAEFDFEPNFRFVNTFAYACVESKETAKNYVMHYFDLTDSVYKVQIKDKLTSPEFDSICSIISIAPQKRINTRFKLYYGSQGTGKTTQALQESNGACMVCHSAMLPSDLMEDFKFNDGKAAFTPSALYNAMLNGTSIVLDEINLLPFESLRFLQSIVDGKPEFIYKGQTVQIKDGFKIIGTMNLHVNGCVYSLPEPLVDRCEEIKEFKLTADSLMSALA